VVYFYSGHWCVFTPALTVIAIVESGDGETLADLNDIMDCPL